MLSGCRVIVFEGSSPNLTRDGAQFFEELISLIQVSFFIKFRRLKKLASVPASDSTAPRSTERVLLPRTCLKCRR